MGKYQKKIKHAIEHSNQYVKVTNAANVKTPMELAKEMIDQVELQEDSTLYNPCSKDATIELTWLHTMLGKFGDNEENFHKFFSQIRIGCWEDEFSKKKSRIFGILKLLRLVTKGDLRSGKYVIFKTDMQSIKGHHNEIRCNYNESALW